MKFIYLSLIVTLLFTSCREESRITQPTSYQVYMKTNLPNRSLEKNADEINFWMQRLGRDTGNHVDMLKLASAHLQRFRLKGSVQDLHLADSFLRRSSARLNHSDPDILFAMSQSSVSLHRFRDAAMYTDEAGRVGGNRYIATLLEFDAAFELGEYKRAGKALESIKDHQSFDYLIRRSKWEDLHGNIQGAIRNMEKASELIPATNFSLKSWAASNLGDLYGHAGEIKKSYSAYLNALSHNSNELYALKGIARIVWVADHDALEARRILNYILEQTSMPDCWLMLAEIATSENDIPGKKIFTRKFIDETGQPEYGNMYNKYMIALYTDELNDVTKAVELAKIENSYRPTPETYDWLAWALFNAGEKKQAYALSRNYVFGQNHEPSALYHTARIFADNGQVKDARELLETCLESSFELGPVQESEIREFRNSL